MDKDASLEFKAPFLKYLKTKFKFIDREVCPRIKLDNFCRRNFNKDVLKSRL